MLGEVLLEEVVGVSVDIDHRTPCGASVGRLVADQRGFDLPFAVRVVAEWDGGLFVAVAEDIGHPGSHRSQL